MEFVSQLVKTHKNHKFSFSVSSQVIKKFSVAVISPSLGFVCQPSKE